MLKTNPFKIYLPIITIYKLQETEKTLLNDDTVMTNFQNDDDDYCRYLHSNLL